MLSTAKDITVVGEGGSGKDALVLAERLDPHVIVMDLSMPDMDGLTATRELQKANALRPPKPGEPITRRVRWSSRIFTKPSVAFIARARALAVNGNLPTL